MVRTNGNLVWSSRCDQFGICRYLFLFQKKISTLKTQDRIDHVFYYLSSVLEFGKKKSSVLETQSRNFKTINGRNKGNNLKLNYTN